MATKQANSLRSAFYNGSHGNLSKVVGVADFSGDAAGTVVQTIAMDAGTILHGLKVFGDALGASTGYKVGVAYSDPDYGTDDDDLLATVADSTAATTAAYSGKPITFEYPVMLTVTVTGGAGTGSVTIVPEYTYRGPN